MTRAARARRWHIEEQGDTVTLSRRSPARFDIAVTIDLPAVAPLCLAHQVRQDVWRALRGLRGFSPVVRIARQGEGVALTAGGSVAGRFARAAAEARLRDVLEDPANRTRWIGFAGAAKYA